MCKLTMNASDPICAWDWCDPCAFLCVLIKSPSKPYLTCLPSSPEKNTFSLCPSFQLCFHLTDTWQSNQKGCHNADCLILMLHIRMQSMHSQINDIHIWAHMYKLLLCLSFQVPCSLEFWDELQQAFVPYREFSLSESRACQLQLPSLSLTEKQKELVASDLWRIVLNSNGEGGDEQRWGECILSCFSVLQSVSFMHACI